MSGHSVANIDLRESGRNEEVALIHQIIVSYQVKHDIECISNRKCTDLNAYTATLAKYQRSFVLL